MNQVEAVARGNGDHFAAAAAVTSQAEEWPCCSLLVFFSSLGTFVGVWRTQCQSAENEGQRKTVVGLSLRQVNPWSHIVEETQQVSEDDASRRDKTSINFYDFLEARWRILLHVLLMPRLKSQMREMRRVGRSSCVGSCERRAMKRR